MTYGLWCSPSSGSAFNGGWDMRTTITPALLLSLCLLAMGSEAARARVIEEIQYTFFVQIFGNETLSAQFLVPTVVTADVTIPSSQLESCQVESAPCTSVTLLPDSMDQFFGKADEFEPRTSKLTEVDPFPVGVFQSLGTNFDSSGQGLVSIKQVPVAVPEPPTQILLLIGAGLLGLGLWRQGQTMA
jgi:hypothetical protein